VKNNFTNIFQLTPRLSQFSTGESCCYTDRSHQEPSMRWMH